MSAIPPPPGTPAESPAATDAPLPGPAATAEPAVVLLHTPPRPGELTLVWRIVVSCTWVAAILALAAVWNASVQLGLSTWWLGPRGDPQPRVVQLAPFLAPALMVLGTVNNVRRLGQAGLLASGYLAAFGLADLGRAGSIAATELLIAGATAAVSAAALTGTYRAPIPTGDDSGADHDSG